MTNDNRYTDCRLCARRCVPRADRLCGDCRKATRRIRAEPRDDNESPGVLRERLWFNDRGVMRYPKGTE